MAAFWIFFLPMLLGVISALLFALTFNNLTLPMVILILLGGLIPTLGYLAPFVYLIVLLVDDHAHIRTDTELGKFIDKWYELGA